MFERLLEPGCTERPSLRLRGGEMEIAATETLPDGSDAAIRRVSMQRVATVRCALTVWASFFLPPADGHVLPRASQTQFLSKTRRLNCRDSWAAANA